MLQQEGLALLRAGNLDRHWFVGPPVFCRDYPAGKPANNSPSNEPHNELNQFHFIFPFTVIDTLGFQQLHDQTPVLCAHPMIMGNPVFGYLYVQ